MSESKLIQCPVEGCSYEGPKGSVQAHYSSKKDGLHPGGINKITELLVSASEKSADQAETEPDNQTDNPEPDTEPQSTPESTGGENPTFGSADPVTEPEPQTQPSEQPSKQEPQDTTEQPNPDEYVCLDCGGELVDFRQHERGSYSEVSNGQILVRGEWLCSDCGKWWFDE